MIYSNFDPMVVSRAKRRVIVITRKQKIFERVKVSSLSSKSCFNKRYLGGQKKTKTCHRSL